MSDREPSPGAIGWIYFAGVIMIVGGGFSVLQALGWLINKDDFPGKDEVFSANVTTWAWVQLILGAVVVLAGFGVFTGNVLARTIGVLGAALSMLSSFVSLPFYPVWGIIIIAADAMIIWALTAHGRDIQQARQTGMMS
jgi:hypothetical protein